MRLENLYQNFGNSSEEDQLAFIVSYRLRRAEDMSKPSTFPKKRKKVSVTSTKTTLTEEEKVLVKLLGLKQKDILALRASVSDEQEDDADKLLQDYTYAEDEDE